MQHLTLEKARRTYKNNGSEAAVVRGALPVCVFFAHGHLLPDDAAPPACRTTRARSPASARPLPDDAAAHPATRATRVRSTADAHPPLRNGATHRASRAARSRALTDARPLPGRRPSAPRWHLLWARARSRACLAGTFLARGRPEQCWLVLSLHVVVRSIAGWYFRCKWPPGAALVGTFNAMRSKALFL